MHFYKKQSYAGLIALFLGMTEQSFGAIPTHYNCEARIPANCNGDSLLSFTFDLNPQVSSGVFHFIENYKGCFPTLTEWRGQGVLTYGFQFNYLSLSLENQEFHHFDFEEWLPDLSPFIVNGDLDLEGHGATITTSEGSTINLKCD